MKSEPDRYPPAASGRGVSVPAVNRPDSDLRRAIPTALVSLASSFGVTLLPFPLPYKIQNSEDP